MLSRSSKAQRGKAWPGHVRGDDDDIDVGDNDNGIRDACSSATL